MRDYKYLYAMDTQCPILSRKLLQMFYFVFKSIFSGVLRGKKVCKTVSSLVVFVLFEFFSRQVIRASCTREFKKVENCEFQIKSMFIAGH